MGSQFNFSGSLIAATSQELGQITSTVMHSFQDFRKAVDEAESRPAIAILDEPMMRGLAEADLEFLFGLGDVTLGLAFCNECYAVDCYLDDRIRLRATSIFPLNVRLDIWLSIVKLVAHGGNYICPEVIAAGRIAPATESVDDCGLTPRQHDVLRLVADGQSNKRIAAVLGLSIHTVKLHLHNANLRLGARNRTEAAMHYRAMCP
ncbi:response regulator transcription factor [Paracoccus sp. M683]|uniref:helix-turn-helix transcriptional regulator n=1 Tax=Paracoccus sp. M683 TaxID=2594268 RepID=UPI00163D95F6|nr:response regulator transcription factor [Paracoccus sp. M683]